MDDTRWTGGEKAAVAEAFSQVRDELRGQIEQKLDDHPTKDQVVGIVGEYFDGRAGELRQPDQAGVGTG
jgi:hypothetical protein